jgi:phospholipid transport system substrate-binding protein
VTNEVLDIVRKDKDIQSGNTKKAIELVEAKVLPHFNFTRMTQLRWHVTGARPMPRQQKDLTDEFRQPAGADLFQGPDRVQESDHRIQALCAKAGETDVRVRTEIKQSGAGKNIELDYFSKSPLPAGRSMTSRSAASVWSPTIAIPLPRKFATTASTA